MNNREKYPNAQIKGGNSGFYISLDTTNNLTTYLVRGKPSGGSCLGGWHPTEESAKKALEEFMNKETELEKLRRMLLENLTIRLTEKFNNSGEGIEAKIFFDDLEITSDYIITKTW